MTGRPLHAWARNETTRTPAVVITLATVPGTYQPDTNGELPAFQWAVSVVSRETLPPSSEKPPVKTGTNRDELADTIDYLCRRKTRTWLYAHTLAVHLSASGLLDRLAILGWIPIRSALDGPSPSVEMGYGPTVKPGHSHAKPAVAYHQTAGIPIKDCYRHPDLACPYRTSVTEYVRRLVIADAGAIWPRTTPADIAADLGITRSPRPPATDTRAWAGKAAGDATVLLQALETTLEWWDANDCGNWGKTGATSGWNAMRHRMSREATFVDTTHPATSLERSACYGGRRGLFRFGALPPGSYEELDFYRAYTVVARDCLLPTGRRASFTSLPLDHITVTEPRGSVGLIAEVTISRGDGRFPLNDGKRVWYPDGRFTTVLAGPDIREAKRLGVLEAIHAGQWYSMGHTLAPWARWCLDEQANLATPPIVVRTLKHHGRAVIGKTAAHAYQHKDMGPAHHLGFKAEPTVVGPERKPGWVIDLGGKRTLTYPDGEGEESFPAILAYVESYVRVRLSRIIAAIGTSTAVQCDTDGLVVDLAQLRTDPLPALPDVASPGMPFRVPQVIEALQDIVKPLQVREKAIARTFTGTGPQHYQLGAVRKRSGIPANARPDGKGNLTGITYPSLIEQASRGQRDRYVPQPWSGKDPPCVTGRWVLQSGRTIAPEAALNAAGKPILLPWELTAAYHAGLTLGPVQDPVLTATATDPGPGWTGTRWTHADLQEIRNAYD